MTYRFYRLSFFLALIVSTFAYGQSNELSRIGVKGNKFVTADGKQIVFRGLDTSDPNKLVKDGHWNKAYFQEMKKWGANITRFPVHPASLAGTGQRKLH